MLCVAYCYESMNVTETFVYDGLIMLGCQIAFSAVSNENVSNLFRVLNNFRGNDGHIFD